MLSTNLILLPLSIANSQAVDSTDSSLEHSKLNQDIESIEVFAQKRWQSTLDVSVAVTSLDGEVIDKNYLKDTTQLGVLVPNLKISNNAGEGTTPSFNIRGVGVLDYNTSTVSPIAVYSDGVVSGSANNLSSSMYDLDNVEVLRGPQGTLFGRNTTGGAILLNAKMPSQTQEGYIRVGAAENDHTSLTGAYNLPLTNNTAVRVAFNQEDYNYSTNNLMAEQSDGGLKKTNMRIMVRTELEALTVTAKLHQEDWEGTSKPIHSLGLNKSDGSGKCQPSEMWNQECVDNFGNYNGGGDYWDVIADNGDRKNDTDSWGAALTLDWSINPNATLTSITGYKNLDRQHGWDSDGPTNTLEGSMDTDSSVFSQELTLSMQFEDAYWITGLYYFDEEIDQNNDMDLFRDFRSVPELAAIPAQFFYDNSLENKAVALYTQVDYSLTPHLILTAGLRYTDESTDYHAVGDLDVVGAYIPSLWDVSGEVEDDEFSGKLALTHKIDKNISMYYSYARGYKSGGYNAGYSTSAAQALNSEYAPEKLDAYEIGNKVVLLDKELRINSALFYYDYTDQQVFVNQASISPYHVLENAGNSTIYGAETEIYYTPSANLELNLNVGYLPEANIRSLEVDGERIDADTRLPMASDWNVSGYALYELPLGEANLITQLSFDYQSEFYFDQNKNAYTEQDDFIVFNGRITYQANEQFELSLWGKNLFDEEHSELLFDSSAALGAITELKAEGRQLGGEIRYSF